MIGMSGTKNGSAKTAAYVTPVLKRFGSATELTKARAMSGQMDGGANNSRTG